MGLDTSERTEIITRLRTVRNSSSDDLNIYFKEKIKKALLEKRELIYALHNTELEADDADLAEYYGDNIRPYLMIPEIQDTPKHYICYETDFTESGTEGMFLKRQTVTFTIMCDRRDIDDKETGLSRHDLLAMLIKERFHHSNLFGCICLCINDSGGVTDDDWVVRSLVFEVLSTNGITQNGTVITGKVKM